MDAVHSMELEHAILDGLVGAGYINRCGAGKETCGLNPRKKIGRLGNRKDLLKAESMFNAREIMMRERASKGKEEKEEEDGGGDDDDEHKDDAVSTTGKAFYGENSNESNSDDKIEEAGELDERLSDDELDEDDALTKMMNFAAKGMKYLFSSSSSPVLDEDDPLAPR